MGTRRLFIRDFKLEAVKLVSERGVKVEQAGRDLGVGKNVHWAAAGAGKQPPAKAVPFPAAGDEARRYRGSQTSQGARTKTERNL
jgi:transposase